MNIYKQGKQWYTDYYVGGKRYRQSLHTESKAVAEKWAKQINVAKEMPSYEEAVEVLRMFYKKPAEGVVDLDTGWQTYEDLAKATGKDTITHKTLLNRKSTYFRFVKWVKENRPTVKNVEDVTGPVAAGFATYLKQKGLKSKTRINTLSELGTVWKLLQNAIVGISNPWGALRPQDTDGTIGKAFTPQQERLLFEAAKKIGKNWYEITMIMRHTGLRYEDVALMTWDAVQGDVLRLKPNKTKRHGITVGIPIIGELKKIFDSLPKIGEVIFPLHEDVYRKNSSRFRKLNYKEVLQEAGLAGQGYSIHSWRHTAATRMAGQGVGEEIRKSLMGHTVATTAARYDHDEHLDQKREALEMAATVK